MNGLAIPMTLVAAALLPPADALAFRNCDPARDSSAYRASSRYLVGELVLDAATGAATGTETHFNYSNRDPLGTVECHVTYDLEGHYQADAGLLLLQGNRVNYSHSCDEDFIAANYPERLSHVWQALQRPDGQAEILRLGTGEAPAAANWGQGLVSYKTPETCELH